MTFLVFLRGSSLFEGVGIVSTCPNLWNNFKTDVFKVDPLIVITSVTLPSHQVLAFSGKRGSTKFE